MTAPPTLRTSRLVLSPPTLEDHAELAAMWSDPAVYAGLQPRPLTREEAWHRLLRYVGHWQLVGYGHWLAREADSGAYVGEVGLMDSRRLSVPDFEGTPEAAWAMLGRAQGRGFAREAVDAMLAWADAQFPRTVCIIAPTNAASLRLAARAGYQPWMVGTYRDLPIQFLERSRP